MSGVRGTEWSEGIEWSEGECGGVRGTEGG